MRPIISITILLIFFQGYFNTSYAATTSSNYVLPYPGLMPGNKLYSINQIFEEIEKYYSFGDFASFKYNLNKADKYLVEAKTLFEYRQYPLAIKSLKKSNAYFKMLSPLLEQVDKNKKNIKEKKMLLDSSRNKHIEVLNKLRKELPETFIWQDEKKEAVKLLIREILYDSMTIRLER